MGWRGKTVFVTVCSSKSLKSQHSGGRLSLPLLALLTCGVFATPESASAAIVDPNSCSGNGQPACNVSNAELVGKPYRTRPEAGAFLDIGRQDWWHCDGWRRTVFAVTSDKACETGSIFTGLRHRTARFIGKKNAPRPAGAFEDPRNGGEYWRCPKDFIRDDSQPVNGPAACMVASGKACDPGLEVDPATGACGSPTPSASWNVGAGSYDITGPAADRGMVGYGKEEQTTQGIHTRLWSRAFVVEDPSSNKIVAFVSADLQSITTAVHMGVMKKIVGDSSLAALSEGNVMLTATHVHVGPGGYDHNVLLNLTAKGYDPAHYNTIVNGIYQSIKDAYSNRRPGGITMMQGRLADASINRNPGVYDRNPDAGSYSGKVNDTMTVLKLESSAGQEIGMISWFAVHNVSSDQTQRLITGDNKGVAAQYFEKLKGVNLPYDRRFVAAFANSEEGDVSPNVCGPQNGCAGNNDANTTLSAKKQFDKAVELYNGAGVSLSGALDHRFQYVTMPGYSVGGAYTGGGSEALCPGALGFSFMAGSTHDGPSGSSGIFEGMTQDNESKSWNRTQAIVGANALLLVLKVLAPSLQVGERIDEACHYPKPTVLPTVSSDGNTRLYTDTLPFQIFQVGELAIIGVPGEMTTIAGHRLRNDVKTALASRGVTTAVIAGLANAYGGYIATKEEYAMQHYEGAHTLYGPNTLGSYRQILTGLAKALTNGQAVANGQAPADLSNAQTFTAPGVLYDDKRLFGESFGQVMSDAKAAYSADQTVTTRFRSGHPQNNHQSMGSFLEVQQNVNGNWVTVLSDNDTSTKFTWIRDDAPDCLACSFAQLQWTISDGTPAGTYRLHHKGHWKNGTNGSINAYSGTSRSFTVTP